MSNGKGSTQRPKQITDAELAARWAATFGHPIKRREVTIGGVDYIEVEEVRPNGVSITRCPVDWYDPEYRAYGTSDSDHAP